MEASESQLLADAGRVVRQIFPGFTPANIEVLSGGLINTNIRVDFSNGERPVVFRIYRDGTQVCSKEAALLRFIAGRIPAPRLIKAFPGGLGPFGPFCILDYVAGITFQQLKRSEDLQAANEAASAIGTVLSLIASITFERPGRLQSDNEGNLVVGEPYTRSEDPIREIMEQFLASPVLRNRISARLIAEIRKFIQRWTNPMPELHSARQLVHSDFGNQNILVRKDDGAWVVAAVLDWEFAFSGSPLIDVGHFLRYERIGAPVREPFFTRAFESGGGVLPDQWRQKVRALDLTALLECLTREELPHDVLEEILGLIDATLKNADPP